MVDTDTTARTTGLAVLTVLAALLLVSVLALRRRRAPALEPPF